MSLTSKLPCNCDDGVSPCLCLSNPDVPQVTEWRPDCESTYGDEDIPCRYVEGHEGDHVGDCPTCGQHFSWPNEN